MAFNRLKKDKKLQLYVIIAGIILIYLIQTTPEEQSLKKQFPAQSVCDTCGDGIFNLCDHAECVMTLGCIFEDTNINTCKAGLDVGDWISVDSDMFIYYPGIYPSEICKTGEYVYSTGGIIGRDRYVCIAGEGCEDWQKPFAGILDAILKKNEIGSCATKAYMVMGFGGIFLLALI